MAGGFVSKEEYLKRYLSGADVEDKKKKRKRRPKGATSLQSRMKIFDDDITVHDVAPTTQETEEAEEMYLDEGPTVEGMVDERPEDVQQMEAYRESKQWKKLGGKGERHDSDSDSDVSPTRRQRHDSGSDESPARRQRHDSGSDQSPARKQRHDSGSDQSPVRRQRQDSGSDQSPPRRQKQGKSKHASDSDQSPPRRKNNSDSDQSPPRKQQRDSDSDLSPPRKSGKSEDSGKSSKRQRPSRFAPVEKPDKDDKGRSKKTLSGLTAGLSTARAMRMENDAKRKREQDLFDKADDSTLGKGARTVFRDKETGRRRNLAKESEAEAKENAVKEELLAKYKAWGKGLKQATEQNQRVQEAMHEADKPLARARGDDDLEDMLKDKERDGDPMLAYVRKKKQKTKSAVKEIPRYRGPQPPANRFNIWPGYRWDGVDRSNGFEKSLFQKGAERKAVAEDAYKWSIEDM